ncbi:hypothetical protein WME94_33100 [Sorangium sp. So ce429]
MFTYPGLSRSKVLIHDKDHGGSGEANAHGKSGGASKGGGDKGNR